MKLLLLYAHDYWLRPWEKNLPEAPDVNDGISMQEGLVALIHVEPHDLESRGRTTTKAVKQIKWLARKSGTRNVVLHSFAHLATESAPAPDAQAFLDDIRARLHDTGFTVQNSPFGYFNEFRLHVGGPSLAKVFVEI
jgi:hypothetical protein